MSKDTEAVRGFDGDVNVAADKVDPIHQFHIIKLIPINIGGYDLSFTNSALFMVATVVVAAAFLFLTTSSRSLVPGRLQSVSEMAYEFVGNMLRDAAGTQGMKFFPLRVLAVHVRAGRQPAWPVPLFLHRHQPHHRHLRPRRCW